MINQTKVKDLCKRITQRCVTDNKNAVLPKYFAGFGESRYVIKLLKYTYGDKEMHVKTVKLTLDDEFNTEDNNKIIEDLFNLLKEEE